MGFFGDIGDGFSNFGKNVKKAVHKSGAGWDAAAEGGIFDWGNGGDDEAFTDDTAIYEKSAEAGNPRDREIVKDIARGHGPSGPQEEEESLMGFFQDIGDGFSNFGQNVKHAFDKSGKGWDAFAEGGVLDWGNGEDDRAFTEDPRIYEKSAEAGNQRDADFLNDFGRGPARDFNGEGADNDTDISSSANAVGETAEANQTRTRYVNGAPVVEQLNENGEWEEVRNYSESIGQLQDLMDTEIQSFDDFAGDSAQTYEEYLAANPGVGRDDVGSVEDFHDGDYADALSDYQSILEAVESGATDEDREAALGWAAQLMGFDSASDYQGTMSGMQEELVEGAQSQEGFSDEEESQYRDVIDRNIANSERQMTKQLDAIAASNQSTMQYLSAADEARAQVSDQRAQQELGFMQQEYARKSQQFEQKQQQYGMLLQSGQISTKDYINGLRADRMNALQGYAENVSNLMQEYQFEKEADQTERNLAFNQWQGEQNMLRKDYSAHLEGIKQHADTIYKAINTQVGIDSAAMGLADELFAEKMRPVLAQLNAELTARELDLSEQAQEASEPSLWDKIIEGVSTGAEIAGSVNEVAETFDQGGGSSGSGSSDGGLGDSGFNDGGFNTDFNFSSQPDFVSPGGTF